jgi:hypothetical protein
LRREKDRAPTYSCLLRFLKVPAFVASSCVFLGVIAEMVGVKRKGRRGQGVYIDGRSS